MLADELPNIMRLKNWLIENGGGFHPHARFVQAPSGSNIVASEVIPADTSIVSCPFGLAITQTLAQKALASLPDTKGLLDNLGWSERQWIGTYICFHWFFEPERAPEKLAHFPYLSTLPPPEKLRTPLHFSPSELEAFKGTNIYGATLDREREWRSEWTQCHSITSQINSEWASSFTWDKYLTAATYISSRAFPSSLLSPTPSLKASPSTGPVLLPGVDSLNHARGRAVSWVVTYPNSEVKAIETFAQGPSISLVLHTPVEAGKELLNNYGPKPNSELIMGYGFSIPNNPDDTIILKVGGMDERWEIGRDARGAEGLWMKIIQSIAEDSESTPTYEDQLDASGILADMVQTVLDRLPEVTANESVGIRPEVASMLCDYVEGQREILYSLIALAQDKEKIAIELARSEGVELVLEDE